jgi:D-tyrosyl-tRNA(Tyr) deacylase
VRGLVQRVNKATVSVHGEVLGSIESGLVVFLGLGAGDTIEDARYLAEKVLNLRVFPNDDGRFDRSVMDIAGGLLLVSQFTLYADTRRGRRPSFTDAMEPAEAEPLYERTVEIFRASGRPVATGRFAEHMVVEIHNDGPVTVMVDSADRVRPRT